MVHRDHTDDRFPRLAGRGMDDLIDEYFATADIARRDRLSAFFDLCIPADSTAPDDRHVKVAVRDDLEALGRIEVIKPKSGNSLNVLDHDVPDMDVCVINLSDSTIMSDQTALIDSLYVTHEIRHMSGNWLASGEGFDLAHFYSLNRADRTAVLKVSAGCVSLSDANVYFLFHAKVGCVSFGHFVLDTLIQLIAFDHLKARYPTIVPLIANDQPWLFRWPGMEWLFSALVAPLSQIVHLQSNSRVRVQRAFTSNRLVHIGDGGVSIAAFTYLRRRIDETFTKTKGAPSPRFLYVSRKDVAYREAGNIDEVERVLQEHDFQTVVVADLTPQQAFDVFRDAEVIVGMHGSGLMYHLYARNPATVIELSHPGFEWEVILACAEACGHRALRIGHVGSDVDLTALRRCLASLSPDAGATGEW